MKLFLRSALSFFFARRPSARRDHEAGKLATLSVIQFATHLLEAGYDIRTPRELFGHTDVSALVVYTRVLNRGPGAVRNPPGQLGAAIRGSAM